MKKGNEQSMMKKIRENARIHKKLKENCEEENKKKLCKIKLNLKKEKEKGIVRDEDEKSSARKQGRRSFNGGSKRN